MEDKKYQESGVRGNKVPTLTENKMDAIEVNRRKLIANLSTQKRSLESNKYNKVKREIPIQTFSRSADAIRRSPGITKAEIEDCKRKSKGGFIIRI